jgi:hypothetical protein
MADEQEKEEEKRLKGSELVSQFSDLARSISELNTLTGVESSKKRLLIDSIRSLRAQVEGEVELSKQTAKTAGKYVGATLDKDSNLVLIDKEGGSVVRSLDSLEGEDFVSVAQNCIRALQKLAAQKLEAVIESKKPLLLFRVSLAGSRLLVFDWRSYHVSAKNSGAPAKGVRVTIQIGETPHTSDEFELAEDEEFELDLKEFARLEKTEFLKVGVVCKDSDSREYRGSVEVPRESEEWQRVALSRVKEAAPAPAE